MLFPNLQNKLIDAIWENPYEYGYYQMDSETKKALKPKTMITQEFVLKRCLEQMDYMLEVANNFDRDEDRKHEIMLSASNIMLYWMGKAGKEQKMLLNKWQGLMDANLQLKWTMLLIWMKKELNNSNNEQ